MVTVGRNKQAHNGQHRENGGDDEYPFQGFHCSNVVSDAFVFYPGTARQSNWLNHRTPIIGISDGTISVADALEGSFGLNGEADGDFGRAVENLEHVIAQEAVKFAQGVPAAGKLNAPIAGAAVRTDDIGFFVRLA